jgi:hypothetical protein
MAIWVVAIVASTSIPVAIAVYYLEIKLSTLYASLQSDANSNQSELETKSNEQTAIIEKERCEKMRASPFSHLSNIYYLYFFTGMTLYGAMVPFWFAGSQFLQEYYGLSVLQADSLLLIPEGSIILLSIPLGYINDRYLKSASTKLYVLSMSIIVLPISYLIMIHYANKFNYVNESILVANERFYLALIPMILLGFGYGVSNCMFWTILIEVVPGELIGPASGLLASGLNVLPSLVPFIVVVFFSRRGDMATMVLLTIVGSISATFALVAGYFSSQGNSYKIVRGVDEHEGSMTAFSPRIRHGSGDTFSLENSYSVSPIASLTECDIEIYSTPLARQNSLGPFNKRQTTNLDSRTRINKENHRVYDSIANNNI